MKTKTAVLSGKPYAGNPHVRFEVGGSRTGKPRRGSLLYNSFFRLCVLSVSVFSAVGSSAAVEAPRHILVRDFRTVKDGRVVSFNIGTAAHGPATLAVLQKHLPGVKLSVWADAPLAPELQSLMERRFPGVRIHAGLDVPETDADLFLVSSGSSIAGSVQRSIGPWREKTGRPVAAYAIGFGPRLKPLTQSFSFCFFRDKTALAKAEALEAAPAVTGFAPDAVFDFDAADEAGAEAFLRASGLEAGKFVCAIPGERTTARWTYFGQPPNAKKAALNAAHELSDNAIVCAAIVEAVRKHDQKVLLCAEQRSEMPLIERALLAQLPDDVKARCVCLKEFWSPDLALGVYRRCRCVFGIEMHSQVMAIGSGVPGVVMRHAGFGSKSDMMKDIGLGEWLLDIDEPEAARRAAEIVGGVLSDEVAARTKLAAARTLIDKAASEALHKAMGVAPEDAPEPVEGGPVPAPVRFRRGGARAFLPARERIRATGRDRRPRVGTVRQEAGAGVPPHGADPPVRVQARRLRRKAERVRLWRRPDRGLLPADGARPRCRRPARCPRLAARFDPSHRERSVTGLILPQKPIKLI